MSFFKKWISCIVSFVAGVLGLALSACNGMTVVANINADAINSLLSQNTTETVKAFEIITDSSLLTQAQELGIEKQFITLKVFSIIMLVVSILLIIHSLILLLKNVNVIKSNHKAFDVATTVLTVLFIVSVIAVLVSSSVYAAAFEQAMTASVLAQFGEYSSLVIAEVVASIGIYQWLMLAISIVALVLNSSVCYLNKKSA